MSALGSIGVVSARSIATTAAAGGAGALAGLGAAVGTSAAVSVSAGALFGLAYGTAIRIGYEQIYPALFPPTATKKNAAGQIIPNSTQMILLQLEQFYNLVGGKAAHIFGIEQGVTARTQGNQTAPDYTYVPQEEPNILVSIDNFFKTLTTKVSSISLAPLAYADLSAGQKTGTEGLGLAYGNLGGTGPPDPSQEIIIYKNMTKTQLLNNQPSQVAWIRNSPDFAKHQTAWQIALEKFSPSTPATTTTTLPYKGQKDATKPEALAWIKKRDTLIIEFSALRKVHSRNTNKNYYRNLMSNKLSEIRKMSNDYRHPNTFIQSQAIVLRKLLTTSSFALPSII